MVKFATKKTSAPDGELYVVSRDLQSCVSAADLCPSLQVVLDSWDTVIAALTKRYQDLNNKECSHIEAFKPASMAAPLPRAYQWADGSAYVNHVELVRKARGATMPENFWHEPLLYQGGSDSFIGPEDPILIQDLASGLDFEAELAVVTGATPMGVSTEQALEHVRLLMLVNDVSLRNLIPNELAKGFGFFQSKPSSSFSPVAVTPDELGSAWSLGKVHLPLVTHYNGELFGAPEAGVDMTFCFARLISHAAHTRPLAAGTIIGSGTVSNYDRSKGSSCIAEKRMLETLEHGTPKTGFMQHQDTVRIEMFAADGQSIFGAIAQQVQPYATV